METKKDKDTLKIPVLKRRNEFRIWKDRLLTHLRTKEVGYHLTHDVQSPILIDPEIYTTRIENIDGFNNILVPQEFDNFQWKLPNRLAEEIQQNKEKIKVYHEESNFVPDDFFSLIIEALVLIVDTKLYTVLADKKKWIKAKRHYIKEKMFVNNQIKTTIARERVHIFTSQQSNFQGFKNIEKSFLKETDLEQAQIIKRLSTTKFKFIRQYIDAFDSLVCEYVAVGGNREDRIIHSMFLTKIPDKYSTEKNIYNGSTLDQAMDYFRNIGDRETTYADQPSTTSTKREYAKKLKKHEQ